MAALVRGGATTRSWLGVNVELRPGGAPAEGIPALDAALPSLVLETPDQAELPCGLTLQPHLAASLIDRTLGGEGVDAAAGPLNDVERGVLAYAVGRWLGSGRGAFRVRGSYAHPAAMWLSCRERASIRWPLEVRLGGVRGSAELWLPASAPPRQRAHVPAWARTLPVTVRACVGAAALAPGELSALGPGDVLLPDWIDVHQAPRGELGGTAHLSVLATRWTARCALGEGGLTVLGRSDRPAAPTRGREPRRGRELTRGREPRRGCKEDPRMSEDDRGLNELGDTPVTLTVEIARFELPLGEVASLAPGEVLSTGRALGHEVTLRAGERLVARGELVDVEGEVGVRIVELPSDGG